MANLVHTAGFYKLKGEVTETLHKWVRNAFLRAGEEAVKTARLNGQYTDQTGNLRSSIGYALYHNGEPVTIGATKQYRGAAGDGSEGVATVNKALTEGAKHFPKGYALFVTAGMNYASDVENHHHKDVLSSGENKARETVERLLKGLTE